jgi:hypothetical protein
MNPNFPETAVLAPFIKKIIHILPAYFFFPEIVLYRNFTPLATGFQPFYNGLNYFYQVKLRRKTSFSFA